MLGNLSKYCSGKRLEINKYLTELGFLGGNNVDKKKQMGGKRHKKKVRRTKRKTASGRKTRKNLKLKLYKTRRRTYRCMQIKK